MAHHLIISQNAQNPVVVLRLRQHNDELRKTVVKYGHGFSPPAPPPAPASLDASLSDELERLVDLCDRGVISEQDFQAAQNKLR